jgi:hypothetical protein
VRLWPPSNILSRPSISRPQRIATYVIPDATNKLRRDHVGAISKLCASSIVGPIRPTDVAYRHVARRLTDGLSGIDWPRRPGRGFFCLSGCDARIVGGAGALAVLASTAPPFSPAAPPGTTADSPMLDHGAGEITEALSGPGCDARPALAKAKPPGGGSLGGFVP